MKLVTFQSTGKPDLLPGLFTDRGVVSLADAVPAGATPTATMTGIIDDFDRLRPALERLARDGKALPAGDVRLRAPLPRPGKILACIANYWEHGALEARPLNMFLKSADAVIGPGDTIVLPEFTEPWIFMHEAELALVIKGPAKSVKRDNWRNAVFGYTGMIDVSARGEGRRTWKTGSWLGKSFDTFAPIGPCIATIDEIPNPNDVHVQFWVDGQLRHNYNTDDMEHLVPELVEFATTIMTLNSGDLIACGTNHEGLGPLQNGEVVDFEIHGIGRMRLDVRDPLKRTWDKGHLHGRRFDSSRTPSSATGRRPHADAADGGRDLTACRRGGGRPRGSRPGRTGAPESRISRSTPRCSSIWRAARIRAEPAIVQAGEDGQDEVGGVSARLRVLVARDAGEVGELGVHRLGVESVGVAARDAGHPRAEAADDDRRRRLRSREIRRDPTRAGA